MRVVFIAQCCEHVLRPMCDVLYEKYGKEFVFVEVGELDKARAGIGSDSVREYIYNVKDNPSEAKRICEEAELVIFGAAATEYIETRIAENKPTIYYSERLFKKGAWQKLNPVSMKKVKEHFVNPSKNSNFYLLAASSYAATDFLGLGAFKDRIFKWGYQIEVKEKNVEEMLSQKSDDGLSFVWVGRLVSLKHCDHAIKVVSMLKKAGYEPRLAVIGDGPDRQKLEELSSKLGVKDNVEFKGLCKIDKTRETLDESDVFLFTSNFKEGWGVTLNEAMNSCCACVASHAAGSTNFLLEDGIDGMIYTDGDVDMLYEKVKKLVDDKCFRQSIAKNAYKKIFEVWNPNKSTYRLIEIIEAIINKTDLPEFKDGPCSKAEVLKHNWYNG